VVAKRLLEEARKTSGIGPNEEVPQKYLDANKVSLLVYFF